MDKIARNSLKKALDLVRGGKYDRARPILIDLLQDHPNLEQAWFLLSYTLPETERQIYALQQALKVNPNYTRAQDRLARLRGEFADEDQSMARAFDEQQAPETSSSAFFEEEARSERAGDGEAVEESMDDLGEDSHFEDFEDDEEDGGGGGGWGRIVGFVLLFVLLVSAIYLLAGDWLQEQAAGLGDGQAAATATETVAFRELPPTWTPGAGESGAAPGATPSATPTEMPSPTPTPQLINFPAPDEATQARMNEISAQVVAVRGWDGLAQVTPYLIERGQAVSLLETLYLDAERAEQMEDERRILETLGLIPGGYSLIDYTTSSLADQAGSLYLPDYDNLFVIDGDLEGQGAYYYALAYEQALADHAFDLPGQLAASECSVLSDSCRAARALLDGDATVLAGQWLTSFGDDAEAAAVQDLAFDEMLVQGQPPPDFVPTDLAFPYIQGASFVNTLLDQGGWAAVDGAFADPPTTTEQILHPEKYQTGEGAERPDDVGLPAEMENWEPLLTGSMGEWLTYLLFFQGADQAAQLPIETALSASAGWAGDYIQVYEDGDGRLLLGLHYRWEGDSDAEEWLAAMAQYMNARTDAEPEDYEGGQCWNANGRFSCIFANGDETLWLDGPGQTEVGGWLAEFEGF